MHKLTLVTTYSVLLLEELLLYFGSLWHVFIRVFYYILESQKCNWYHLLSVFLREFDWIWKSFSEFLHDLLVIGIYIYTTPLLKCLTLSYNLLLKYIRLSTFASFIRSRNSISEYTCACIHTHTSRLCLLLFCIWRSGMKNQQRVQRKLSQMIL